MSFLSSLCIYCGSAAGHNPRHREAAARLGRMMAEQRVRLIYGGGRVGLMGIVADAVLAGGGVVVGVIPEHLQTVEVGHGGVSELFVVDSMHERKHLMFGLADAFAVLPGGFGTLDEAFEILTWRQLRLHDRPVILVNIDGYWDPLLGLVDHVVAEGFARPEVRGLFTITADVEGIFPLLARAPEPALPDAPERL
jgi:uncharacterized protein (TIGR00730 family)